MTEIQERTLVSRRMIADRLGVKPNQVFMWQDRRETSGFPLPVDTANIGTGRGHRFSSPVWDLAEVLAWQQTYVPVRGGAGRHQPGCQCASHRARSAG